MSRVAIYPGSFDPPTLAHQEILRQAQAVFDRVVVIVAKNGTKEGTFHPTERVMMWQAVGLRSENYRIGNGNECVVDWAQEFGARYVVRGLRDASDVAPEQAYRKFVKTASAGGLEAVYFMSPPDLQHVSSTVARQILALRGREHLLAGTLDPRVTSLIRHELAR